MRCNGGNGGQASPCEVQAAHRSCDECFNRTSFCIWVKGTQILAIEAVLAKVTIIQSMFLQWIDVCPGLAGCWRHFGTALICVGREPRDSYVCFRARPLCLCMCARDFCVCVRERPLCMCERETLLYVCERDPYLCARETFVYGCERDTYACVRERLLYTCARETLIYVCDRLCMCEGETLMYVC